MDAIKVCLSLVLILLATATLSLSLHAACAPALQQSLSEWIRAETETVKTRDERRTLQESAAEGRKRLAAQIWQAYRQGDEVQSFLDSSCLAEQKTPTWLQEGFVRRFEAALSSAFFRGSLESLSVVNASETRQFLRDIDRLFGPDYLAGFRVFAELSPNTGALDGPAGVSPGTGSVVTVLSKLQPEEWLLIFVHEMAHALDTQLIEAERRLSSDKRLWIELAAVVNSGKTLAQLNESEQKDLREWSRLALDRGLFAEVRAWTRTLKIWAELRASELNTTLPEGSRRLFEPLLASPTNIDENAVLLILRPRFRLPSTSSPQQLAYLQSEIVLVALNEAIDEKLNSWTQFNILFKPSFSKRP